MPHSIDELVSFTSALVRDAPLKSLAGKHNLEWVSVAWEDTGRAAGSCWGTAIADFTLAVGDGTTASVRTASVRQPFLKGNNFTDLTADYPLSKLPFKLRVGNAAPGWDGTTLADVSLGAFLADVKAHLGSKEIQVIGDLRKAATAAGGDEDVLVAGQACVLPVPCDKFYVACQPYSRRTLVIVSTVQGTSVHLVDGYKTTPLFYNHGGKAAQWRAEHLKAERARLGKDLHAAMDDDEKARNAVIIIQVPLKQKEKERSRGGFGGFGGYETATPLSATYYKGATRGSSGPSFASSLASSVTAAGASVLGAVAAAATPAPQAAALPTAAAPAEAATYGFGHVMIATTAPSGTYKSGFSASGDAVERDETLPIRVTLQFYAGTDKLTTAFPEAFMALLSSMVFGAYRTAAALGQGHGSLVTDAANRAARTTAAPPAPSASAPAAMNTGGWSAWGLPTGSGAAVDSPAAAQAVLDAQAATAAAAAAESKYLVNMANTGVA